MSYPDAPVHPGHREEPPETSQDDAAAADRDCVPQVQAKEAHVFVAFTVTIDNGATSNYDPTLFMASAQSGSVEASEVFDSENGFNGPPTTKLLPGRTVTFKVGYGVQDPKDIVLEVTPGFDYDSAIFTS